VEKETPWAGKKKWDRNKGRADGGGGLGKKKKKKARKKNEGKKKKKEKELTQHKGKFACLWGGGGERLWSESVTHSRGFFVK